jgi:asparagine synthase (glutamine-hydrolysing)
VSCPRFLISWDDMAGQEDGVREIDGGAPLEFVSLKAASGLTVWISNRTPSVELPEARGWIIGSLFRNGDPSSRVTTLTSGEAERIVASQGKALIDEYWGSYLAVLSPGDNGMPSLLRDASGFMPCYFILTKRGALFASDIELLFEQGLIAPSVDWRMLYAHLQTPELRRQSTCLAGLVELGQGHSIPADGRGAQRMLWSPLDHVNRDGEESAVIAQRLEATILSCTAALASSYSHILVGASGGLDSSIVCAALADTRRPFTCFTMATRDPSGDERRFVRDLALTYGSQSREYFYDVEKIDPKRSSVPHLPRPVGRFFMQAIESSYRDAWGKTGADVIFTGNGGDNVFSFLHSASPVVDRWITEGMSLSSARTIADMCRITGCDVWTMLKGAVRSYRRRHMDYQWPVDNTFLAAGPAVGNSPTMLTPWLVGTENVLPGKRLHIAALMRIQHAIEGYARKDSIPVIPVLLSQPVMEICLSIPSWLWCEGGINRAMARRAFKQRLPPSVVQRISKAGPDSLSAALFERALPVLRDRLLDGLLVCQGLIDRQAVEEALARTATRKGPLFHRLLALAEAEAWSRFWHGRKA